jgi:hypothetical protein
MPPPRSLAGLTASVEVQTTDLYAALKAIHVHTATDDDLPLLQGVHVSIRPDGNAYLMATDRFTAGLAVVSIWDDHLGTGEEVDVDLSQENVSDLLHLFKPRKNDPPEAALRLDVSAGEVHVTEVAGMIETEADKHVGLPRSAFTDPYPDVPRMIAGAIWKSTTLRRAAEETGAAGEDLLDPLFLSAVLLGRFAAAERAYRRPLVMERTAEARGALLIGCGESFVGLLMPVRAEDEQVIEHRGCQSAWLRRLPEPGPEHVAMPDAPRSAEDDEPAPSTVDLAAAELGAGVTDRADECVACGGDPQGKRVEGRPMCGACAGTLDDTRAPRLVSV